MSRKGWLAIAAVLAVVVAIAACANAGTPDVLPTGTPPAPTATPAACSNCEPAVVQIHDVEDASSMDWARTMDVLEVALGTGRPLTFTVDGWDFCSECDSEQEIESPTPAFVPTPAPLAAEVTVNVTIPATITVPIVMSGTVNIDCGGEPCEAVEPTPTVAPIPMPELGPDPCWGFWVEHPLEVSAGEIFTVTLHRPEGVGGDLWLEALNAEPETFSSESQFGSESFQLRSAPGLGEGWIVLTAEFWPVNGDGPCTLQRRIWDPPALGPEAGPPEGS